MKFEAKYAGKWVAAQDNMVVASDKTLTSLMKKVKNKDQAEMRFALIPKNYIAGFSV